MRKKGGHKTSANNALSHAQQQKFEKYAQHFRQYTAQGEYKKAIQQAALALKIMPNQMQVIADLAFCLLRDEQYQQAYLQYKHIFHSGDKAHQQASDTWLDGLAEVCGWLDKKEELQRFGCLSLRNADAKVCETRQLNAINLNPEQIKIALQKPRPQFNSVDKSRNIISFSLFGNLPKYCESAVINAQVAKELFPQWTCRFYVAQDVPLHVTERLKALNVQLVMMDTQVSVIDPLLWRFIVLDDESVDFYMIRDADSLLSEKEQAAVQQWLNSGYWFHHMRDYFTHTELLLAGMWAGARGTLSKVEPLMKDFCESYNSSQRFIDQYFLRQFLWPQVKDSLLCHDDIFKFHHAQPFPEHSALRWQNCQFHIGSNCSYQQIVLKAPNETEQTQVWRVLDNQNVEVCRYQSIVENNQIQISLPFVYVQKITANDWRISFIRE